MKYDLDIFNKNDEENVKSLLDVAYNHSIEKNYFFIIPLLEICNDFGVPIDENYLVKISDFINNTDINNADITEDKFVLLIYKYQLAKASNITDDNNLRRKIIDGYNNNFLKYENQEELLGLILLADIQISSDNNISQLFNEDFKRIKFIIEHQRFEEEGGREISFYELYVSLFILKY
ncbi:MAG: hypothetical protein ACD_4C00247G0002 [uncultured bacterium (gcode 4)]|uniref:Uncharacterized protein n=1 Tax=uncultured bacterium (gcode 4) TaxID=1234023 RepID=K2FUE7_9BACT|nr:MAG: hypothetical protein ACD_4C00247G0002 [uncultured bacterium (gcode 4)]